MFSLLLFCVTIWGFFQKKENRNAGRGQDLQRKLSQNNGAEEHSKQEKILVRRAFALTAKRTERIGLGPPRSTSEKHGTHPGMFFARLLRALRPRPFRPAAMHGRKRFGTLARDIGNPEPPGVFGSSSQRPGGRPFPFGASKYPALVLKTHQNGLKMSPAAIDPPPPIWPPMI
jgi:hypothetical protein